MPLTCLFPFQSRLSCSSVRSSIGLCTGKSYLDADLIKASFHLANFSPFQGATAPSYTLNLLSGITRSGSMPRICEKPSQTGHAPKGLLKENRLGTGSSNTIPSSSNRSLNNNFFFPSTSSSNEPSPSKKAVLTESDIRWISSSSNNLTTSRSTSIYNPLSC